MHAPVPFMYVPAAQDDMQADAPALEYVPEVHGVHMDAAASEYVPAAQIKQALAPAAEYVPAAQAYLLRLQR